MSRIGKLPVAIPAGVTVTVSPENIVTVKGPKGELKQAIDPAIKVEVEGAACHVTRPNDEKEMRAKHGLYRALIHNMVVGVHDGYKATLELVGVGYRVELAKPQVLNFSLPQEVKVETKAERNQNPLVILESADKQLLGQICAKIRSFRMPEPYKGKGIRFQGEVVRRKAGKSAGK